MPLRSPKMYSFIFGFQRLVWCPKCTPASSNSFIDIAGKLPPDLQAAPQSRAVQSEICAGPVQSGFGLIWVQTLQKPEAENIRLPASRGLTLGELEPLAGAL